MVNQYLFLAYSFVWALFMFYAWTLSRRQARLRRDLETLKRLASGESNSGRTET